MKYWITNIAWGPGHDDKPNEVFMDIPDNDANVQAAIGSKLLNDFGVSPESFNGGGTAPDIAFMAAEPEDLTERPVMKTD